jgi:hypothetical protein
MARTIAQIQAQMDAEQALQPALSGLTSNSQTAIYTLWKYIMSVSIFIVETLTDTLKAEIETTIANQAIGSDSWLKGKVDEFQFSSTVPQVLTIVNHVAAYSTIDTTLQIITRSTVSTLPSRLVSVKVAKSDPPEALSGTEKTSLEGYLDKLSFSGVAPVVTSLEADKMFLEAEVFYDGQYASTISADVIVGLEIYMASLDFDSTKPEGKVNVEALTDAVQGVTGVNDIVITGMAMRSDTTAFGSKVFLVDNKTLIFKDYPTIAGYVVEEDTAGETLTDKLTFTPSS